MQTSVKTPIALIPILGNYAPIKSTITINQTIAGRYAPYYQLDIDALSRQQFDFIISDESRRLSIPKSLAIEKIRKQGYYLPASKYSSAFGIPDRASL